MEQPKWKEISTHNDICICGFFGDYRWLSNFHLSPVVYEGLEYPSSENAYQAAKVTQEHKWYFQQISPNESKSAWKDSKLAHTSAQEWDKVKYGIMASILFRKFEDPTLRQMLLDTEYRFLEESNYWHDTYWGVHVDEKGNRKGENNLGKILMNIRRFWTP